MFLKKSILLFSCAFLHTLNFAVHTYSGLSVEVKNFIKKEGTMKLKLDHFEENNDPSIKGKYKYHETTFEIGKNAIFVFDRDDTITSFKRHGSGLYFISQITDNGLHTLMHCLTLLALPIYVLTAGGFNEIFHDKFMSLHSYSLFFKHREENMFVRNLIKDFSRAYIKDSVIYTAANPLIQFDGKNCVDKEPFLNALSKVYPDKEIFFFDNDKAYCDVVFMQYLSNQREYPLSIVCFDHSPSEARAAFAKHKKNFLPKIKLNNQSHKVAIGY